VNRRHTPILVNRDHVFAKSMSDSRSNSCSCDKRKNRRGAAGSLTGPREPGAIWFDRGSASAQQILAGEVWRTVTALTLHADLAHVVVLSAIASLTPPAPAPQYEAGSGLASSASPARTHDHGYP
jgi:hypothetical protein